MGPRPHQHLGAGGSGRTRRQDVVHEEDPSGRSAGGREHAPHRPATGRSTAPSLWPVVPLAAEQACDRQADSRPDDAGERLRLIESAVGAATPGERDPGHDVRAEIPGFDHRGAQGVGDGSPARELEPVDGGPGGSVEQERGPGMRQCGGRTVAAHR